MQKYTKRADCMKNFFLFYLKFDMPFIMPRNSGHGIFVNGEVKEGDSGAYL